MREGRKLGLLGYMALRWIGDVGREVAAVDCHCGPALQEVVQHLIPFIAVHADRPGLAEQAPVHVDGRDRLGTRESGLVVLDHGSAIREHEAHGWRGGIAAGLGSHRDSRDLIGLDRLGGREQFVENLGNWQVPGCQRIPVDEQGHRLGRKREAVAFAIRPQREGSGRFDKVALVVPAEISQ